MKACQATKGVLTGLPGADLREWTAPWWVCHDTFDGAGRHKLERMREAPMVVARERSSLPYGMMLCRMLTCGRSEAWWLVSLSGPVSGRFWAFTTSSASHMGTCGSPWRWSSGGKEKKVAPPTGYLTSLRWGGVQSTGLFL